MSAEEKMEMKEESITEEKNQDTPAVAADEKNQDTPAVAAEEKSQDASAADAEEKSQNAAPAGENESEEKHEEPAESSGQEEEVSVESPQEKEEQAKSPKYDNQTVFWDDMPDFSKEQWILTHIGDENLLEYLKMEHQKEEERQRAKDTRQKRILSAFQLTISLVAVIVVIFLLRDNPTVMVNILYIIAIIAALWIWKNPRSKQ